MIGAPARRPGFSLGDVFQGSRSLSRSAPYSASIGAWGLLIQTRGATRGRRWSGPCLCAGMLANASQADSVCRSPVRKRFAGAAVTRSRDEQWFRPVPRLPACCEPMCAESGLVISPCVAVHHRSCPTGCLRARTSAANVKAAGRTRRLRFSRRKNRRQPVVKSAGSERNQ